MRIKEFFFGKKPRSGKNTRGALSCIGRGALNKPGICDGCPHRDVKFKPWAYGMRTPIEAVCRMREENLVIGKHVSHNEVKRLAERIKKRGG